MWNLKKREKKILMLFSTVVQPWRHIRIMWNIKKKTNKTEGSRNFQAFQRRGYSKGQWKHEKELSRVSNKRNEIKCEIALCTCELSRCSHEQPFATLWTVAQQVPMSRRFSRQERCSGLPCPPPGDLSDPGIGLASLMSPDWQVGLYH